MKRGGLQVGVWGLCLLMGAAGGPVQGDAWTGTLRDGSVIRVDPQTHRPMRYYEGGVAPLWNGVHQLDDGTAITVREGTAVPTESMLRSWRGSAIPPSTFAERYCDQLARKACGFHQECAVDQPCVLARQLLRMESEERRRAPIDEGVRPATESSLRCQESLGDDGAFPVCAKARPNEKETPCRVLVERVCGGASQCAQAPACDPARQLLRMELDERLVSADPDALTPAGVQCEEVRDNEFFALCKP